MNQANPTTSVDALNPNAGTATSTAGQTNSQNGAAAIDRNEHKRNLRNAQDAMVAEFHTLVGDAERLLKHTSTLAGAGTEELRHKLNENLQRAKTLLKDSEAGLREHSRAAVQATEQYVHQHPLQSVGIAAGVGFLLGLLVSRR